MATPLGVCLANGIGVILEYRDFFFEALGVYKKSFLVVGNDGSVS
jgi:hypothetical protein